MRVIFLLMIFCTLVNGDCTFRSNDSKVLQDKVKQWKIYKKIIKGSTITSKYQIGICVAPNSSVANGAILQQQKNDSFILGQLNTVSLTGGDDWILLTYENGSVYNNECNNRTRLASIMFICGKNTEDATVIQEHTNDDIRCNYMFLVQIPEMCPVAPPQEAKGMSGGGIFLIIVLCLVGVYLIGGFLFMRIVRGARGIEQVPNLEMWRRVGHLAADGCDYCCRCNTHTPRADYFLDETEPDTRGDDDILAP